MPLAKGIIDTGDYGKCKDLVFDLKRGETKTITVDHYKRCQKYIYEIGLKCKPRREFSTKKQTEDTLRVTRII